MSAFDKRGEHVENLARVGREELVHWIDQAARERNRARRAADLELLGKRMRDLRVWFEQSLADLQREHEEACEALPRLEARLKQLHARLDQLREEKGPSRSVAPKPSAEREAKVATLIARVQAGDLTAVAELKGLI